MTDNPQKVIECPCGVVLRGGNDDETIEQAQRHARENHDMTLSRDQAIAMARPA
jgi:predicted small metal-binding protein